MSRASVPRQRGPEVHLYDVVDPDQLDAAIEAKLVNERSDAEGRQLIYNYSDAALYSPGAWDNPAVRHCRGLIVDAWTGNLVARAWSKFFNHGQAEAGHLDMTAPVEVTDKLDGSLGIVHRAPDGQPRVATRGSFTSDQALHATELLRERYAARLRLDVSSPFTPLVEIIYPANRIVVDYGDLDDLVLLGGVSAPGHYYGPASTAQMVGWDGPRTEVLGYPTLKDALAAEPRPNAEGLVVRRLRDGQMVKIKQDDYVRLHKIVTGLSERSVWEQMAAGGRLDDLLAELPDELHDWTRDVWAGLDAAARDLERQARDRHDFIVTTHDRVTPGWSRREYAEAAKKASDLTPLLFQILDGKDPRPAILRRLKPAGHTPARPTSEATA